jgi:hypothetical protein
MIWIKCLFAKLYYAKQWNLAIYLTIYLFTPERRGKYRIILQPYERWFFYLSIDTKFVGMMRLFK